mmetsp:Transcript_45646/g.67340  ORF Transcript_45646/g.67340 Transcript_45646/m.67340 type:complete len:153 (-) Transcript_45646:201-659(-)
MNRKKHRSRNMRNSIDDTIDELDIYAEGPETSFSSSSEFMSASEQKLHESITSDCGSEHNKNGTDFEHQLSQLGDLLSAQGSIDIDSAVAQLGYSLSATGSLTDFDSQLEKLEREEQARKGSDDDSGAADVPHAIHWDSVASTIKSTSQATC